MIWRAPAIYGFVRKARFTVEQWAPAIALALAVSGGDDEFHLESTPRGVFDLVGLFGVDLVAYPQDEGRGLYGPQVNANVAAELTRASGGSFAWAPRPIPPLDDPVSLVAREAVRRGVTTQAIRLGLPDGPASSIERTKGALADLGDYLRSGHAGG